MAPLIDTSLAVTSERYRRMNEGIPRLVANDHYAENFAQEWHQHAKTQYDWADSTESTDTFLAKTSLIADELRGRTVLDYGCGSGCFREVATRLGASVVGLDLTSAVDVAVHNLTGRTSQECRGTC